MNKGFENIEKAQKNVSAYIILDKEKNVFGRIIARSTKNRVCHLTFNIFNPYFSCFYRRARGCGYNKILHSMSSILGDKEVREKLESVGIKFYDNCYEWKSLFESISSFAYCVISFFFYNNYIINQEEETTI